VPAEASVARQARIIGPNPAMRLLDQIVQARTGAFIEASGARLPTASKYAQRILECPTRFVLADDLVASATALAFADGDRLGSCVDLIHAPAERVWVEWMDEPRCRLIDELFGHESATTPGARNQRAGALISSDRTGRRGTILSFWSGEANICLSPLTTEFDLDRILRDEHRLDSLFEGGAASVHHASEPALDELLAHVRFRFDASWADYYRSANLSSAQRAELLNENLRGVAFDAPMLLALFLLLGARDAVVQRPVARERLNFARARRGKAPLLDHIEARASFAPREQRTLNDTRHFERRSSRLHHVRGHLVRRGTRVFWRCPHLRGTARFGIVHSRTVELRNLR
jgi:hypothetical protein